MSRPPLEVADLIRAAGTTFYQRSRKWFTWLQLKILTAIVCCRTSALGGHIDECSGCGCRVISFNSCRNRHCPKCQSNARDRWLEARRQELLPVPYAHVVFTLPRQLAPLALQNKSEIYGLLFRTSAETLLTVARDERHLGADIGFFSVLHTWNQKLQHHPDRKSTRLNSSHVRISYAVFCLKKKKNGRCRWTYPRRPQGRTATTAIS